MTCERDAMSFWLLMYCKVREERRAQQHLANLGFETYVPVLQKKITKAGKSKTCIELLFPRYLFLRVKSSNNLSQVRNTRGIRDFVRFGGKNAEVADSLIVQIMNQQMQMQQQLQKQQTFHRGDPVVLLEGPFAGFDAIYQAPSGDARSVILLSILQKQSSLVVNNESLTHKQ